MQAGHPGRTIVLATLSWPRRKGTSHQEDRYAVDAEAVRRAVTPRTKLIVVTNLHNPSSVLTGESVLREIGEIARSVGARCSSSTSHRLPLIVYLAISAPEEDHP